MSVGIVKDCDVRNQEANKDSQVSTIVYSHNSRRSDEQCAGVSPPVRDMIVGSRGGNLGCERGDEHWCHLC